MLALRKLPAFAQMAGPRRRMIMCAWEADFVETALSARRYAETEIAARDLLCRQSWSRSTDRT